MKGIKYRYFSLWLARKLNRFIYRWLYTCPGQLLFWFLIIAIGARAAEFLSKTNQGTWVIKKVFMLQPGTLFGWKEILALYALFLLIWWIWQGRKRVVVEEFVDYAGDPARSNAKGLGPLLVVELSRLRSLYQIVDEQRAIPTATGAETGLDATFKGEDISEFLKGAVSAGSKLSLGPFEIPVGIIMGLIGRIVQGPRLIGSLHQIDGAFILTAQMIEGQQSRSWRVEETSTIVSSEHQADFRRGELLKVLACRIFADLELGGAVKWQAVSAFSEGLRAYRDCLRTPKERKLNLKSAERKFIEAISEDENFDLAYYNLGVVYTELRDPQKAELCFKAAIGRNPNRWEAYYGLALNPSVWQEPYDFALNLCERVITLKPDNAKAYDLLGLAQRYREELEAAVKSHHQAVSQSWKALCKAELRDKGQSKVENSGITQARETASLCLRNLAKDYVIQANPAAGKKGSFKKAVALFRQAQFLEPSNPDLHFELGKTYHTWKEYDQAIREYNSAIQITPARSDFWAYLALASATQGNPELTKHACEKILNCVSLEENIKEIEALYKEFDDIVKNNEDLKRIAGINKFLEDLEKDKNSGTPAALDDKLSKYQSDGQEWEFGQVAFNLGEYYRTKDEFPEAASFFEMALKKHEKKYPQEIRRQYLLARLARLLKRQKDYAGALQRAEQAIKLNPLSPDERTVLGNIYFELNQFAEARATWEEALLWDPDAPEIHANIGMAYIKLAGDFREATQRNHALQQAAKYLGQALDLYDGVEDKGRAHSLLGQLYLELSQYASAIPHFRIAQTMLAQADKEFPHIKDIIGLDLGWAYLKNKAYDECIEELKRVIDEVNKPIRAGCPENKLLFTVSRDQISLGEILAKAYLYQAFSYAERDANLDNGLRLAKKAKKYIESFSEGKKENTYLAAHADCEGWIYYKKGEIQNAIQCLESALSLTADAGTYLRLALVYEQKLMEPQDQSHKNLLTLRIHAYCQHVEDIDIKKEYIKQVSELQLRLQGKGQ